MSEIKNEVMTLDIKVKLENTMVGEYIASLVQADKLEEFLTTYTLAHLEGSFISSYGRNLTEKMLEDSVMNNNFDMDFDEELDNLFDESKEVTQTSFNPTNEEEDDDYDDMFLNNDESKDIVSDYDDLFGDMDDLIAEEENVNNRVQNKKDSENNQEQQNNENNENNHEGGLQFIDEEDDDDDYESMFLSNDDENKEKKIDTSIFDDDDDIIEEDETISEPKEINKTEETKETDKTKEPDKTVLTNECAQLLLSKMEEILNKLDKGVAVGAMPVIGANLSRPTKPLTKTKTTVEDINPTEDIDEEDGSDLLNNLNWDEILEINLKLSGGE